jgi:hypothetical protein
MAARVWEGDSKIYQDQVDEFEDVEDGVELGAGAGALDEVSDVAEGVFASAAGVLLSDSDLGLESESEADALLLEA